MTDEEQQNQRHSEIKALLTSTLNATTVTSQKVDRVHDAVGELSTRFLLHEKDDDHVHESHGRRLKKLEKSADASGAHNIERTQQQLIERRDSERRWRDRGWGLLAALVVTAAIALVTFWVGSL